MVRFVLVVLIVGLLSFVSGCASRPTHEQIVDAYYGAYPNDYDQIIQAYYAQQLFDPYSARYTFTTPRRDYNRLVNPAEFGWVVCGTVNAKNRLGAYVGAKPFYVLIRDDRVVVDSLDSGFLTDGQCRARHGPDDPMND